MHHFRNLYFGDAKSAKAVGVLLNSHYSFLWFVTIGNGRNLQVEDVTEISCWKPIGKPDCSDLFDELMDELQEPLYSPAQSGRRIPRIYPSKSKQVMTKLTAF